MQSWKETSNEFKAEGLKLLISVKKANLAWDVCVLYKHIFTDLRPI